MRETHEAGGEMLKLISRYRNGIGHRECKDLTGHPDAMLPQRKDWRCALCKQADKLGGDQDSRDVEQVIGNIKPCQLCQPRCERIAELEAALAQTRNSLEIEQDAFRNMQLQRDEARAALAQKTRECEELNSRLLDVQKEAREMAEAGLAQAKQVEQLQRQVASLSKPVTVQELKKHGCQGLAAVASVAAVNCVIAARAAAER